MYKKAKTPMVPHVPTVKKITKKLPRVKKQTPYSARTPLKEGLKSLGKILKGPKRIASDKSILGK